MDDSSTGLHVLREKVENSFTSSVDDLEDPYVKHMEMEMENEDDMLEVSFLYSLLDEKRGALFSCSYASLFRWWVAQLFSSLIASL